MVDAVGSTPTAPSGVTRRGRGQLVRVQRSNGVGAARVGANPTSTIANRVRAATRTGRVAEMVLTRSCLCDSIISMKWTQDEETFLRKNYLHMTAYDMGVMLNRSMNAVSHKLGLMGLRLTKDQFHHRLSEACLTMRNSIGSMNAENNPNWKGGISKNSYRYKLKQKEKNPQKVAAREAVYAALRRGEIARMPCEICGNTKVHSHHDDYDNPLKVRWLCAYHHRELHKNHGTKNQ
jgi:hypothetical protein